MRKTFLSLLLFAAVVEISAQARQPPVCPTMPRPKGCRTGLSDQCTKDSDCPVFIRCCWDGCNKRCVDTSSRLKIYAMRSKYGVCERPSMNKCTASFDMCFDDSYCLGDEKCCLDTDCGKKCMLPPLLQAIKNSTKAFNCPHVKPDGRKCSYQPKHQCSMDSECPSYTTCCFDGCRKRCTDRNGRMVLNKPGYLCPILPPPVACPRAYKECDLDDDCSVGMKCCSDTCNNWCMPSHPPPAVTSATPAPTKEPSFRNLYKPGKCPVLPKPKSCQNQAFECNYDVDCWNSDKKCCDNGCVTICVDPVFETTSYVNLLTEKRTKAPTTQRQITKEPTTTRRTTSTKSHIPSTQRQITKEPTTTRRTTSTKPHIPSTSSSIPTQKRQVTTPLVKTVEPIEKTLEKLNPTPRRRTIITTSKRKTKETVLPWFSSPPFATTLPLKEGIRITPISHEAVTGQNIYVTCTIKGEPFEGWYTPKGLKITTEHDNGMYVQGRGDDYMLVINKVEQMHGGKYTCRGAFTSANYELNIKLFIDAPTDKQFLQAGTTGIIKVSAKGYPRPQSKWMKDGHSISSLTGRYIVSPSGSLIIKNVQLSDKGQYSITANHYYMKSHPGLYSSMVGSSDRVDITVDVVRGSCPMPKARKCAVDQRDECTSDGDCASRSICCSDGCRQRCVQTGNKELNFCPYLHPPSKCTSTIKECTSDDQCSRNQKCCSDSCHFRCVASQSSNSEIIPGVQTYPTIKSFCNPKQSTRLVCRVDKQPFEGWFDSYGRKVVPETHGSRMKVEDHHEYQVLVIKNVTAKDGGKYSCHGALDSAAVDVGVNRTIDDYEHPIMLYPGKSGLFLQNIQCYPLPRFIWYKRGRPIDVSSNRYSVSPSGSLGIRRIRSIDMGVYTLKFQMGGEMRDTGVQVAAAVDGVDFTEWQDSLAPGASVRCLKDAMHIDLDRKLINSYSASDLSLANTSCRASSNKTHFSLMAPLVGCGTIAQFTKEAVVYNNIVKEYRKDNMITRIQDIRIPFSCFYTKEGVTSTFGLLPTKVRRVMDGGNVTTRFELGMSLYRDESFSTSFGIADFPLRVTVNRPLFVQVKIDSPDKRLAVMSERCYATPTQDARHPMQYDIINDGCAVDPTVQFYKGSHTVQRYSFKAFQFLAKGKSFVYLHCQLIVCNVSDPTSRCAQGCLDDNFGRRLRRHQKEPSAEVELTQGPFILERKPAALAQHPGSSSFKDYIWIMLGMAGFCILCLIAMVYMKKQIHRHSKSKQTEPDPDRETNV